MSSTIPYPGFPTWIRSRHLAWIGLAAVLLLAPRGWAQGGEEWLKKAADAEQAGEYAQATELLGKAAAQFQEAQNWTEASRALSRQGKMLRDELGQMDQAIESFTRVIDLHRAHSEPERRDLNVSHFYNLIGDVFQKKSDYDQAILVYEKARAIREELFGAESQEVAQVLTNMGTAYRFKKDPQKALELYNRALEMRLNAGKTEWVKVGIVHHQLGEAYLDLGNAALARQELEMAKAIFERRVPERLDYFVEVFVNLGKVDLLEENPEAALQQYAVALSLSDSVYGPLHRETAKIHVAMGRAQVALEQFPEAIRAFQQALTALVPDFRPSSPLENPAHEQLTSDPWIFLALADKAEAHHRQFQSTGFMRDLEAALATYEAACEFADLRRAAYWSADAKKNLAQEVYPVYEKAIGIALQLHGHTEKEEYLSRAFTISERSKAALILENLHRETALPPELLDSIKSQEVQIAQLQKELYFMTAAGPEAQETRDRLFRTQERHDRQLASYKERFLGYSPLILAADSVRKRLPEKTALLEYFVGARKLYIFFLSRDRMVLSSSLLLDDLPAAIQSLRRQCETPPQGNRLQALNAFAAASTRVHDDLIVPVADELRSSMARRLIIVPDGPLWYIPFEALLRRVPDSTETSFRELAWLFRDYEISYAYSGTLLERSRRPNPHRSGSILAIAPSYGFEKRVDPLRGDSVWAGFAPLAWNGAEVRRIADFFRTDTLTGTEATEQNFKAIAANYSGIHFSSHASLNDQDPMYSFISFGMGKDGKEDDSLFLYELYAMDLQADMVVLSACETGAGGLVKGEGIMSLARGFAYGGCPSVVMSLWKADDRATFELMERFYAVLAEGEPRTKALQMAKLSYLRNAAEEYAHPFYWAHFVALGDTGPVDFARNGSPMWFWMVAGFLGTGLASYLVRRRRFRKRRVT